MESIVSKINWPLCLGIIAGIIVIGTAIAQWKESKDSELKTKIAQNSLRLLNQKTLEKTEELAKSYRKQSDLQDTINLKSDKIFTKTAELSELYKQNARLQEELKNQVTGGNNKPVINLLCYKASDKNFDKYYILLFDVKNDQDYPLPNLRATINDMPGKPMKKFVKVIRNANLYRVEINPQNPNDNYEQQIDLGTIPKRSKKPLYSTAFNPDLYSLNPNFIIELNWGNNTFVYYINLVLDKDKLTPYNVELIYNGATENPDNYFLFTYNDH